MRILRSAFCVQILVLPLVTCVRSAGDNFSGLQNPHLKSGDNGARKTIVEMKCQNLCKVFSLSFGGIINARYMLITFVEIIVTIRVKIIGRKWEPV